jgi:diketogulonate reductase-like aldo/keto reductase
MGLVVIPKTATLSRISENFAIFDFSLDTDDLAQLDSLETSLRLGGDPETTNYGIN